MNPTDPVKQLPSITITPDPNNRDAYLAEWPDGFKILINGSEIAHGENIIQAAVELRRRVEG